MGWQKIPLVAIALPLCLIPEQLPIRSYTTADGLASDQIDCIVPDSRGFIWFCTPEGLTRFDGYRMVNFGIREGLPDRRTETFLETPSGTYLVGTARGLSQFSSRTGGRGFVTYRQGAGPFDRPVQVLSESKAGTIWCGSGGRLLEAVASGTLAPPKWFEPQGAPITAVVEDAGGKVWVATDGNGVYVLGNNGIVKHITKADGFPDSRVNALLLDHAGTVWAATRHGLASMRNEDTPLRCRVGRVYAERDGLANHDLHTLAEAPDGAIWIGTAGGISVLRQGSNPVARSFSRAQGLTDREITALACDKAGNIWAGTEGAGVMRIASGGFVTFGEQDGIPND